MTPPSAGSSGPSNGRLRPKDLALFRTVRPSLWADEERLLRASFEQVDEQRIEIRIESIAVTGDTAVARLVRQDTVGRSGRSQTTQSTEDVPPGAAGRGVGDRRAGALMATTHEDGR